MTMRYAHLACGDLDICVPVLERAARERGEDVEPVTVGALPAFADVAPAGSCRMRDGEITGIPVIAGMED